METPKLQGVEQVSDGWVRKYVLTYEMPDGRLHSYEVASRKPLDTFRALLERNGNACRKEGAGEGYEGARCPAADETPCAKRGDDSGQVSASSRENNAKTCGYREFEGTPDAVCIVARTPRNSLVMIREFRYPLNSWCVAFPAGLVDAGEDPAHCACRELEEETGYTVADPANVRLLPQAGYSSTGLTDETVLVAFADAELTQTAHTEPNELIEIFELPIADIRSFLDSNTLPIGIRAQLILEMFAR